MNTFREFFPLIAIVAFILLAFFVLVFAKKQNKDIEKEENDEDPLAVELRKMNKRLVNIDWTLRAIALAVGVALLFGIKLIIK